MKNRVKKILKIMTIVLLPIFLQAFASRKNDTRPIKEIKVTYLGNNNMYITDRTIEKLLRHANKKQEYLYEINTYTLESLLNAHVMIEKSEVFHTIDGSLEALVKQREPIGRICDKEEFYYIDSQGKPMPLSPSYSARVPLIKGIINEKNWNEIYQLLQYIREDDFLNKNITEIIVDDKGEYNFRMRVANFVVTLGLLDNLEIKKANLKAFYKKAEKSKLLNTYKNVNLKYSNQVICVSN